MRWLRLDVSWDDSPWLFVLSIGSQLGWIKLLCHVKRDGQQGRCKSLTDVVAAKKWGVGTEDVQKLLQAAVTDGALVIEDGYWTVVNWAAYQESDSTAAERMRRMRARSVTDSYGVTEDVTVAFGRNPSRDIDIDIDIDIDKKPSVYQRETDDSLAGRMKKPTVEECRIYAGEIGLPPDEGENFHDWHTAKGWKIGKEPMKDWRAALRTWRKRRNEGFGARSKSATDHMDRIRREAGLA